MSAVTVKAKQQVALGAKASPNDLGAELGKHDPFESLEQEAYLNILRTASHVSVNFDRLFALAGLSMPLYNTLRIVAGHGKCGVPSQTIAKHLVSRGPDVTRLVNRLVKQGLVERTPCGRDRRVVYIRLLPAGQKVLDKLRPEVSQLHRVQLGHLGPEKLRRLNKLLFEARHPPEEDR